MFVLAAFFSVFVGSVFMYLLISRNIGEKSDVTKSIWSYVFLWPLLLTKKEDGKYVQRGPTRREWTWIIILIVIMLSALIFTPTGRR